MTLRNCVKPSITKIKSAGDKGSPCLSPLVAVKLPIREPLRLIEKEVVDRQRNIQCLNLEGKFMWARTHFG